MTAALLDDEKAQGALPELEPEARTGAIRVLSAFAATPSAETRIDTTTASRIATGPEAWWANLAEVDRARVIAGLGAIDAPTGVRFARRVLPEVKGGALVAAAEVLRDHGTVVDAEAIIRALDGPSTVAHGPTLAAAARLCRLEAE